ncbi:hypothetical protein [Sphingomonas sp. PB4P5]|uniref:hypothetical protein n=1 Tax=Parasphingomonas puruogangriensis TaxID=3096155 RepID=UPI002FC70574
MPNALQLLVVAKLELKRGNFATSKIALNEAVAIFDKLGPSAAIYAKAIAPIQAQLVTRNR